MARRLHPGFVRCDIHAHRHGRHVVEGRYDDVNIDADRSRLFVTHGPLATSISKASGTYFRECRSAGCGTVRVSLPDGTIDWITGSRYLGPGSRLRAQVIDDPTGTRLEVVCRAEVVCQYRDWVSYEEPN